MATSISQIPGNRCCQSSMASRTRSVIVAEGSSRSNPSVLSKPCGAVISTRAGRGLICSGSEQQTWSVDIPAAHGISA